MLLSVDVYDVVANLSLTDLFKMPFLYLSLI